MAEAIIEIGPNLTTVLKGFGGVLIVLIVAWGLTK